MSELGGVGPDRSLASHIIEAVGDGGRAEAASVTPPSAGVSRWLLAACLLGGAGVVGGIAWMRSDRNVQAVQPDDVADPDGQGPVIKGPKPQDQKPAPKPRGNTLVADYSDNLIAELDENGRKVWALHECFGAWDAKRLPNGNTLITEFSVSRVREIDRKGETVWTYEDLKNPYCASRLANGNTLIANTFAGEVIQVDQAGKVVWTFDDNIRPFDAEMTAKGTVLIADVLEDRVIEVDSDGKIVWQVAGMPNAHDADRLPNGNTLITLRNKGRVVEVDPNGVTVWSLSNLSSPSDADRLPNGNTLVAENTRVAEYDRKGARVWKQQLTWCVEANRLPAAPAKPKTPGKDK
ncbi:MAG: hypothetical protein KAI24_00895 [Planctomycetes bacterium]|nr:hypothetical protein [Planctomycetota bacterium]